MKDYIKMMLEAENLKFLVFAHHLTMLQACTEAVIEAKVRAALPIYSLLSQLLSLFIKCAFKRNDKVSLGSVKKAYFSSLRK